MMSVRLSVHPSLKISVTTEPIRFYSSGKIPTGPVVVLGFFLGGYDHILLTFFALPTYFFVDILCLVRLKYVNILSQGWKTTEQPS